MNESPIELRSIQDNPTVKEHQLILLNMGFDLEMINKAIKYSNYLTIEDLIEYLTKENGLWKHPFILKETPPPLSASNNLDNPISLMQSINHISLFQKKICDICGEEEQYHEQFPISNPFKQLVANTNSINSNNNSFVIEKNQNLTCGICLCDIENPITLEKCDHTFCSDCFKQHIEELIKANRITAIPCPDVNCDNVALEEAFFLPLLDYKTVLKYQQFKMHNEIAKDPTKVFCPICESYAVLPQGNLRQSGILSSLEQPKVELTCVKNNHKFCSCGRTLHEGKCYKEGKELEEYIKHENIKKCPKCGFLIKKTMGCNHMICGNPNCNFEFCWICLKVCLPDHYSSGLCEGLQFIEENSFAYKMMSGSTCTRYIYFGLNMIWHAFLYLICIMFTTIVLALEYNFRRRVPKFMFYFNNDCIFDIVCSVHRFHVFLESIFVWPTSTVISIVGTIGFLIGCVIWGIFLLCR